MHDTIIDMHLPLFKKGYQAGRKLYFETETAPTDKDLLDSLIVLFAEEGGFANEGEQDMIVSTLGRLMGQISGAVIAKQADEEDNEAREQRLLHELASDLDNEQTRTLFNTITTFWRAQDALVKALGSTSYERVLCRDMPLVSKRANWQGRKDQ